jgi:hypothetical protein
MGNLNSDQFTIGTTALVTYGGYRYGYQNFEKEDTFEYEGFIYYYLPFGYDPPTRSTEIETQQTQIILPFHVAILSVLQANNFFIGGTIQLKIIQYEFPTVPPINVDLLVITGYSIVENKESTTIQLNIETPFNAINGKFPVNYYTTGFGSSASNLVGYIPEVPFQASVKF